MATGLKIFVTGTSGFIGQSFLNKLLIKCSIDDRIFILVRKKINCTDQRVEQLIGDLREIEKFNQQLKESDYVFHLAANATFANNNIDYKEINLEPTKKIVNILKESKNLKNFIFISTIGAYDRDFKDLCLKPLNNNSTPCPTSAYGLSKLESEKYIKVSNLPYTIIRPTWVYGKDMRANSHINKFVSLACKNSKVFYLNFPGQVSLIHVDDLTTSLVEVINNEKVINKEYFAETEVMSLGRIMKIIYQVVNKKILRQLPITGFGFFVRRLHRFLPLTISNLFIDYLVAKDDQFKLDFALKDVKIFKDGIADVISTNVNYDGFWIITGANSGIGLALSKQLNEVGKKLVLIDKNIDNLDVFKDQMVIKVDLSNLEEIKELTNKLVNYKIYCLINNAGLGFKKSMAEITQEEILKTINVNVIAPVMLVKLLIASLKKTEATIVNVCSSAGYNPLPGMAIYAATKSFLLNWSLALWYELRGKCRVITLSPSGTNTNFQLSAGVKKLPQGGGLLSPEEVSSVIIKSISQGEDFVFLGFKNKIVSYLTKMLPDKFNVIFWGKMFEKMR